MMMKKQKNDIKESRRQIIFTGIEPQNFESNWKYSRNISKAN